MILRLFTVLLLSVGGCAWWGTSLPSAGAINRVTGEHVCGEASSDFGSLNITVERRFVLIQRGMTGARVRFTRNLGNIAMDLDDIETLDLNALGAVDFFTANDLTGTDLTTINAELASTIGGSTGDAEVDTITVSETASPDIISVTANAGAGTRKRSTTISSTASVAWTRLPLVLA